ncbi:MAG TPA: thiamine-phosphate kinase, partial [Thermoanaerobaculia bacterium]|nr:thiamine-phosphate kinase [Thermoanaerobaculia bacterium]
AVLPSPPAGTRQVVTVDSQVAGVHYPADLDPALVGWRLVMVNLSDLAATGADPAHAFLALSAPAGYEHRRFFDGLLAACEVYGVTLAGGDLARTEPAVATLTLTGWLPEGRGALRRGTAEPGHTLWVGGTLGESAAGRLLLAAGATARFEESATEPLDKGGERAAAPVAVEVPADFSGSLEAAARRAVRRHLAPVPQLALGRALAAAGAASAAMDLSDGLAVDLARLCRASRVGAEVEADLLPLVEGFDTLAARYGADPIRLATEGGEDYVLLFTLPPDGEPPAGFDCTRIGRIVDGEETVLLADGERRSLGEDGWDHLRSET